MPEASNRILCIEDDTETAGLIAEELRDRGYDVDVAYSGQDGLEAIRRDRPDLVLSDIIMPGMSGFELRQQFESIPFIFLTGLANRENKFCGGQLRADDYVIKPIDFDMLEAIIKTRLPCTRPR